MMTNEDVIAALRRTVPEMVPPEDRDQMSPEQAAALALMRLRRYERVVEQGSSQSPLVLDDLCLVVLHLAKRAGL